MATTNCLSFLFGPRATSADSSLVTNASPAPRTPLGKAVSIAGLLTEKLSTVLVYLAAPVALGAKLDYHYLLRTTDTEGYIPYKPATYLKHCKIYLQYFGLPTYYGLPSIYASTVKMDARHDTTESLQEDENFTIEGSITTTLAYCAEKLRVDQTRSVMAEVERSVNRSYLALPKNIAAAAGYTLGAAFLLKCGGHIMKSLANRIDQGTHYANRMSAEAIKKLLTNEIACSLTTGSINSVTYGIAAIVLLIKQQKNHYLISPSSLTIPALCQLVQAGFPGISTKNTLFEDFPKPPVVRSATLTQDCRALTAPHTLEDYDQALHFERDIRQTEQLLAWVALMSVGIMAASVGALTIIRCLINTRAPAHPLRQTDMGVDYRGVSDDDRSTAQRLNQIAIEMPTIEDKKDG